MKWLEKISERYKEYKSKNDTGKWFKDTFEREVERAYSDGYVQGQHDLKEESNAIIETFKNNPVTSLPPVSSPTPSIEQLKKDGKWL